MRVLVAGAAGAIGQPLVRQLREAGHEVLGTTRSQQGAEQIKAAGATPVIVDALQTEALHRAVAEAKPEVVINELTSLPERLNYRKPEQTFGATNELRAKAGPALAGAAAQSGARRLISQSICFLYAPSGSALHTEDDPLLDGPPGSPVGQRVLALTTLERATLETPGLDGVVLRYGIFYGPGTHYRRDGSYWSDVMKRRFPIVGKGTGIFSYLHVEDAAAATVAALDRGGGIYNVCDDDPAPMSEWLPAYAEAIGAKPPRRVPVWLARLVAGKEIAGLATTLGGASNAKAKRELGWQPRYPSWRQGFREPLA
jgi:nucleoside-diphosphate-sugar epimerase